MGEDSFAPLGREPGEGDRSTPRPDRARSSRTPRQTLARGWRILAREMVPMCEAVGKRRDPLDLRARRAVARALLKLQLENEVGCEAENQCPSRKGWWGPVPHLGNHHEHTTQAQQDNREEARRQDRGQGRYRYLQNWPGVGSKVRRDVKTKTAIKSGTKRPGDVSYGNVAVE